MPVVSSDKVGTSKAFVSVKSNAPESGGCVQYYRKADILALTSDEHLLVIPHLLASSDRVATFLT